MNRQFASPVYNALKTATRLLVDDLGGVEAAASVARIGSKGRISEYYAVQLPERFIPVDVLLDFEFVAGAPRVTAALARAQGFALMPVEPRGAGDLSVLLAELGRDVSTLFADAAGALGHQQLSDDERIRLARDLDEVARIATETRARLLPAPMPATQGGELCRSIPRRA